MDVICKKNNIDFSIVQGPVSAKLLPHVSDFRRMKFYLVGTHQNTDRGLGE